MKAAPSKLLPMSSAKTLLLFPARFASTLFLKRLALREELLMHAGTGSPVRNDTSAPTAPAEKLFLYARTAGFVILSVNALSLTSARNFPKLLMSVMDAQNAIPPALWKNVFTSP